MPSLDSFKSRRRITVGSKSFVYFSLKSGREKRPQRDIETSQFAENLA